LCSRAWNFTVASLMLPPRLETNPEAGSAGGTAKPERIQRGSKAVFVRVAISLAGFHRWSQRRGR
jgi:hypothetical protein